VDVFQRHHGGITGCGCAVVHQQSHRGEASGFCRLYALCG
jgi:hypothetical protein